MHVLTQFFQTLLMLHAEMLLLVDDEKAEIGKVDRFSKQRVRTDDDIDVTVLQPLFGRAQVFGRDQARGLRDPHRETTEALLECVEVLTGKERCWYHDSHLLA